MTTKTHQGGCRCGAIRFQIEKDEIKVAVCGCKDCQRSSGSLFAAATGATPEQFTLLQGQEQLQYYADQGDSGNDIYRYFCRICGSQLYAVPQSHPKFFSIRTVALDNIEIPVPKFVIYQKNIPDWVGLPSEALEVGKKYGG